MNRPNINIRGLNDYQTLVCVKEYASDLEKYCDELEQENKYNEKQNYYLKKQVYILSRKLAKHLKVSISTIRGRVLFKLEESEKQ